MNKEAKGTIPATLDRLGGGKPLNSALIQSMLFGGAGYLGGKAIGGIRNYWTGDDDKERTDRLARNMGLAGAGLGAAANIPGLRRNLGLGHYAGLSKDPVGDVEAGVGSLDLNGKVDRKARYLKRLFSYMNTTKKQTQDPEFMGKYKKTLDPLQRGTLDSMTDDGATLSNLASMGSDEDRDLMMEMVADNVRRSS